MVCRIYHENVTGRDDPGSTTAKIGDMKRVSAGRRWGWALLGAAAYGLHLAFGKDSTFVENVYSRGVFVGLRWLWDRIVGLSPVPLIYVILAAILFQASLAPYSGTRP